MSSKKIKSVPPEEFTGIKRTKIPKTAVGVKAISSALSHVSEEIGLIRGIGLLNKINQKDGFD